VSFNCKFLLKQETGALPAPFELIPHVKRKTGMSPWGPSPSRSKKISLKQADVFLDGCEFVLLARSFMTIERRLTNTAV
jgi:hypothetical protein